jgi:hypothetical protein
MASKTSEIVAEKIIALPVDTKNNKPKNPQDPVITYYEFPFRYEYEENLRGDFKVQLPRILCRGGIKKDENNGRTSFSMKLTFPMNRTDIRNEELRQDVNAKTRAFVKNWDEVLYPTLGAKIVENRKSLGTRPLQVTLETFQMIFKNPIYHAEDKDGNRIPGRDPTMYIKLNPFGQKKTRFYRPGKDEPELLSWTSLMKEEIDPNANNDQELIIDFAPVVWLKKMYCNGRSLSLQMEMEQALIYEPPRWESIKSSQFDENKKVISNDPDLLNRWEDAFKFLTTPNEPAKVKEVVTPKPESGSSSYMDFLSRNQETTVPSSVNDIPEKEQTEPEDKPEPKEPKKTKKVIKKVVKKKPEPPSEDEASGNDDGSDAE